jgi:hypothetical protein
MIVTMTLQKIETTEVKLFLVLETVPSKTCSKTKIEQTMQASLMLQMIQAKVQSDLWSAQMTTTRKILRRGVAIFFVQMQVRKKKLQ